MGGNFDLNVYVFNAKQMSAQTGEAQLCPFSVVRTLSWGKNLWFICGNRIELSVLPFTTFQ